MFAQNLDQLSKVVYDRSTGGMKRQWIRYADDTFEPVRKTGNINKKYHSSNSMIDWWVTEKPLEWTPLENGFNVSLNHDFYGQRRSKAKRPTQPENPESPKAPVEPEEPAVPPTNKPVKPVVPPTEKPKPPTRPGEEPPSRFDRLYSFRWNRE